MTNRKDWTRWLAVGLMLVLGYFVFYEMVQRMGCDLSIHATWAAEGDFANPRTFLRHGAHPLWHALVAALMLTGLPLWPSAALVTAMGKGLEVWLLIRISARVLGRDDWVATLCGVAAALVSAICVPWLNPRVYIGGGTPNTWHSPTQMAALVMTLLCVPLTADCVETFHRRLPAEGSRANVPWKQALTLAAALLVSLLAKPTFMQAFLPAACLYFLWMWIRMPQNSPFFWRMIAAAAPAVLFMVLQYMYYFGMLVPSQGDMTVLVTWEKLRVGIIRTLLLRAFPLYVLAFAMDGDTWKKPVWQLTLLMDVISVVELLLLDETGRRASDGNFGWAMMSSALMLWALTLPQFVRRFRASWVKRRKAALEGQPYLEHRPRLEMARWIGGFVLLGWHVASGIYYLIYLMSTSVPL